MSYCQTCGTSLTSDARFCGRCGNPVTPAPVVTTVTPHLPEAEPSLTPSSYAPDLPAQPLLIYAGFWRRLLAILIDGLLIAAVLGSLVGLFSLANGPEAASNPVNGLVAFLPLLTISGFWFYFMLMESSSWQATIGKKILRIHVTDLDGHRISLGRATGRTFAKYLSGMPLGIGFIMAGFSKKKQALHDMIANCLVLRRP
jgi:uncharacterized RDD family membrane protein YckC